MCFSRGFPCLPSRHTYHSVVHSSLVMSQLLCMSCVDVIPTASPYHATILSSVCTFGRFHLCSRLIVVSSVYVLWPLFVMLSSGSWFPPPIVFLIFLLAGFFCYFSHHVLWLLVFLLLIRLSSTPRHDHTSVLVSDLSLSLCVFSLCVFSVFSVHFPHAVMKEISALAALESAEIKQAQVIGVIGELSDW